MVERLPEAEKLITVFCNKCASVMESSLPAACSQCGSEVSKFFDDHGGISGEYLTARGYCCANGCSNCPYPKTKACERCGVKFECLGEGCWCASISISVASLDVLKKRYIDCVCPECLKTFIQPGDD